MDKQTAVYLPEALFIDVPMIDDQHARLFRQLAELKALCVEKNELPSKEAQGLYSLLREHCATEERLASEAELNFSDHAIKHQQMLDSVGKALSEVAEERMDAFSMIRYLEYWFERHIREEDKNLGLNLQQGNFRKFGEQFCRPLTTPINF